MVPAPRQNLMVPRWKMESVRQTGSAKCLRDTAAFVSLSSFGRPPRLPGL